MNKVDSLAFLIGSFFCEAVITYWTVSFTMVRSSFESKSSSWLPPRFCGTSTSESSSELLIFGEFMELRNLRSVVEKIEWIELDSGSRRTI